MRCESAGVAKGTKVGQSTAQQIPKLGTKIRELWDLLHLHKGEVFIDRLTPRFGNGTIRQLRDFYGLDIRDLGEAKRPGGKVGGHGPHRWILAGEWFGRDYRDYIAERKTRLQKVEDILTEEKP